MVSKTILSFWDVSHFQGRELFVSGIYDWPKTLTLQEPSFASQAQLLGGALRRLGGLNRTLQLVEAAAEGRHAGFGRDWVWMGQLTPWKITGLEDGLELGENIVKANMFLTTFFLYL